MARFQYKGRNRQKIVTGKINASSRREAMERLSTVGVRIIEIEEIPESILTKDISFDRSVKLQHIVVFLRQFSTLLKAGITVVEATSILSAQTESKSLSNVLSQVKEDLTEGQSLSEAFKKHPKIFDSLFINLVKAGELSGTMDVTFERLSEHYEKQYRTKQKVLSSISYPIVVGIIAIAVVIFLLVFVVPTFVSMFDGFGGELPRITKFVLGVSDIAKHYWVLLIVFIGLFILGLFALNKNIKTKYYLDLIILKLPFVGQIVQKSIIARMTRTLSSMLASSVPILQALDMVEKVIGNNVMAEVVKRSRVSLEEGNSLAGPIEEHWAFPPLVSQMIVIGERSGSLDTMLAKVADFYEHEVDAAAERMKALIEPIMIVILAGLVGVIVTAIVIPMFQIFDNIQNF
ncbi:type II secretion system F family protein [Lederbergia wuyishanensis]|uniref:Type IV pilus assembly protein PilC n=1 Tax=Lederbergia wuyishanensis TaxID=1347903 RepID=A0ABU0D1V4_9BACI|nr:type II secretion system F family protein [Lederbergia wuyishanensis]MCJ8006991.1 type II secretion system F family protein [Lederbergia wuyishanensis]MDQ0342375.1 type IV pilus assembly protein PilC [Lederbergia wuyishanensis]